MIYVKMYILSSKVLLPTMQFMNLSEFITIFFLDNLNVLQDKLIGLQVQKYDRLRQLLRQCLLVKCTFMS